MKRALIVHASRHGGTAGIAERIGEVLQARGIETTVRPASDRPDPATFDVVVVGSGVYMGSWLSEGFDYLERQALVLAGRPTWLFSSGPLPGSTKEQPATDDPYDGALGPAEGPGSGGRKRIEELASRIGVREHRIFRGMYDPKDPPKAISERLVRLMPAAKNILPEGDFRDWEAIEAWAVELASQIGEPATEKVPVA
jgi:menaquinone-dependent protoporphyrinogen oxidase